MSILVIILYIAFLIDFFNNSFPDNSNPIIENLGPYDLWISNTRKK